jgi:6-phospho-3-hexuloisomerase
MSNRFTATISATNGEVGEVFARLDESQVDRLLVAIEKAKKIACFGAGREGLMMRALAMRLFHLGYNVAVAGDMTAPYLGSGDLLLLSAGTGFFYTGDGMRQAAQAAGAKVFCLTAQPEGRIPRNSDDYLDLPAQTMASDQGQQKTSALPMGSLFELAQFLLGELIVFELMRRNRITADAARARHTNLE